MKKTSSLLPLVLWLGTPPAVALPEIAGEVEVLEKEASSRGGVEGVFVYVDGLQTEFPSGAAKKKYAVRMENKSFEPRVTVVPVGGLVTFPNLDKIMHNAFSISRGNRFDLGLYKSGAYKTHRFENSGLVRIYCNIHPQMSAFLLVVGNRYFGEVQSNGKYRIEGVPPGTYTVRAWSEKARDQKLVTVGASGTTRVNFTLDARSFKKKAHLNKFGKPYKRKRGKY